MKYKDLEKAVQAGDFAAFKALVAAAGDLSQIRNEVMGGGILHYCVNRSRDSDFDPIAVVDLLLAHGAQVNEKDNDDLTPLMMATLNAHPELVAKLLACGANPELRNAHGATPLFTALGDYRGEENQLAVIRILLEHGAELDTINKHDVSILDRIDRRGATIDLGHMSPSWDLREFLKPYRS